MTKKELDFQALYEAIVEMIHYPDNQGVRTRVTSLKLACIQAQYPDEEFQAVIQNAYASVLTKQFPV